ncbi:MAG: glycosyltransferase [Patescibacteria group bacterium]|nr:glycosyltransferase [Patescibacteria group bacterium]
MKILIVGTKWYGNVEFFYAKAFRNLGHRVEVMYYNYPNKSLYEKFFSLRDANIPIISERLKQFYKRKINNRLIRKTKEFKPQVIIIFNGLQIEANTLQILKENEIILANWIGDDPRRFIELKEKIIYYDNIFITEPSHVDLLTDKGARKITYIPNATDEEIYHPLLKNKIDNFFRSDIAFVGHSYNADKNGILRGKILNSLSNYNLKIYGDPGWKKIIDKYPNLKNSFQNKITSSKETNMIYNASKIIINIHHGQNRLSTAQRTFEIASAGGFQLAEEKKAIKEMFPNNEIVCYENLEDLKNLVKYYLKNSKSRKAKINEARKIVIKKHTYKNRASKILNNLN